MTMTTATTTATTMPSVSRSIILPSHLLARSRLSRLDSKTTPLATSHRRANRNLIGFRLRIVTSQPSLPDRRPRMQTAHNQGRHSLNSSVLRALITSCRVHKCRMAIVAVDGRREEADRERRRRKDKGSKQFGDHGQITAGNINELDRDVGKRARAHGRRRTH